MEPGASQERSVCHVGQRSQEPLQSRLPRPGVCVYVWVCVGGWVCVCVWVGVFVYESIRSFSASFSS